MSMCMQHNHNLLDALNKKFEGLMDRVPKEPNIIRNK